LAGLTDVISPNKSGKRTFTNFITFLMGVLGCVTVFLVYFNIMLAYLSSQETAKNVAKSKKSEIKMYKLTKKLGCSFMAGSIVFCCLNLSMLTLDIFSTKSHEIRRYNWQLGIITVWIILSVVWYSVTLLNSDEDVAKSCKVTKSNIRNKLAAKKHEVAEIEIDDAISTQTLEVRETSEIHEDLGKEGQMNLSFDCGDDMNSTWSSDESSQDEEVRVAYRRALNKKKLTRKPLYFENENSETLFVDDHSQDSLKIRI
jgi:Na+/melibiose symporter-like transporter